MGWITYSALHTHTVKATPTRLWLHITEPKFMVDAVTTTIAAGTISGVPGSEGHMYFVQHAPANKPPHMHTLRVLKAEALTEYATHVEERGWNAVVYTKLKGGYNDASTTVYRYVTYNEWIDETNPRQIRRILRDKKKELKVETVRGVEYLERAAVSPLPIGIPPARTDAVPFELSVEPALDTATKTSGPLAFKVDIWKDPPEVGQGTCTAYILRDVDAEVALAWAHDQARRSAPCAIAVALQVVTDSGDQERTVLTTFTQM